MTSHGVLPLRRMKAHTWMAFGGLQRAQTHMLGRNLRPAENIVAQLKVLLAGGKDRSLEG